MQCRCALFVYRRACVPRVSVSIWGVLIVARDTGDTAEDKGLHKLLTEGNHKDFKVQIPKNLNSYQYAYPSRMPN